jgi:polar amino acid transport system substrate-binding protein
LFVMSILGIAHAQDAGMPQLFGDEARMEKFDLSDRRVLRFLTGTDFAPFQFVLGNDTPAGFNVDLSRALCGELATACTLQGWAYDDLLDQLTAGRVDAVIAGLKATPVLLAKADVTRVYFRIPARFVLPRDEAQAPLSPQSLAGKTIGVVGGSAHEAFLKAFFPTTALSAFENAAQATSALGASKVDGLFADGLKLSVWLNTPEGACCAMAGEPYYESHFFGEGMVIAVRKGDNKLLGALNYALGTLETRGIITDLYLRWFPIGIY